MSSRLLDALAARPLLLDAGMGTRLIARGLELATDDTALWNLSHPEVVREIHGLDVDAGSDAILTNTFGANSAWLDRYGRAGEVAAINRRAVVLARDAAGADRFVLGSIGPTAAGSVGAYRSQAEALAEAGCRRPAAGDAPPGPGDGRAGRASGCLRSTDPRRTLRARRTRGRRLPDARRRRGGRAGRQLRPSRPGPPMGQESFFSGRVPHPGRLLCKPGASHPAGPALAPADFGGYIAERLGRGVRLMGGCCGATEAHVAAMRSALGASGLRCGPHSGPLPPCRGWLGWGMAGA